MNDLELKARAALGILLLLVVCWLLSTDRKAVKLRIVVAGLGLQFVFAWIVLKSAWGRAFFDGANTAINKLLDFSAYGANFVFGQLAPEPGAQCPVGFVFATQILTTIIFFASLMSVLYHLGIMQIVVRGCAWVMQRTLQTSGAETMSTAANIFVGQTEAPLLVKPYISAMTSSELMAIMVGGFATVAGGVLAAYVGMLKGAVPDIAGHLLACSVMAAPGTLMVSKLLVPETERAVTANELVTKMPKNTVNVVDAAAVGASEGVSLALNVAGMLIAFVAMVKMVDALLDVTLHTDLAAVFAKVFAPLAWLMGIETADVPEVGRLLGVKLVLTELMAYTDLGKVADKLSPRSVLLTSYALCGFANFASIAIQIGGIGAMAPERRSDIARLGVKAMAAGFLVTVITAAIAGIII